MKNTDSLLWYLWEPRFWKIAAGVCALLLLWDIFPEVVGGSLGAIVALICVTSPVWGFIGLAVLWGGVLRSAERAIAADVAEELKRRGY